MTVRTRPALDALAGYRPGRTPAMLAGAGGPTEAVKLSGNESAFEPLPGVPEAIAGGFEINRYPDFYAEELRLGLGALLGVDPERVVPGCGSLPLCRSMVEATCEPGDEVVMPALSFTTYAMAATVAGAVAVRVPLRGQALDLDAMADAITARTRVVFVCSPNNPTSMAVTHAELEAFLARVPADVLVALDEAYGDFVTGPGAVDGIDFVRRHANVVSVRTFSKAYGLAGLRIGFAVAEAGLAAVLRKVTSPFSVSKISEAAAIASLLPAAQAELRTRITRNAAERGRVTGRLRELGFALPDSQANFVWIPMPQRAAEFAAECEERGVIIRGFPDAGARTTIGTVQENDAFLRAAADVASSYI